MVIDCTHQVLRLWLLISSLFSVVAKALCRLSGFFLEDEESCPGFWFAIGRDCSELVRTVKLKWIVIEVHNIDIGSVFRNS